MMFERLKVMITVNRISWNNNFRLNDFLFRSKVTKEVIKEVSLCISVLSRCKSPVFLLNFIKLNFSFLETDRVDFSDEKPFLEFVIVNRLDTQSLSAWVQYSAGVTDRHHRYKSKIHFANFASNWLLWITWLRIFDNNQDGNWKFRVAWEFTFGGIGKNLRFRLG